MAYQSLTRGDLTPVHVQYQILRPVSSLLVCDGVGEKEISECGS